MSAPIARQTDPWTSHAAASAITESGRRGSQKDLVLRYVQRHPGLTSGEYAAMTGLDRYRAARRLPDLEHDGDVVKGDARRCRELGTQQVTWWPAQAQGGLL